MRLLTTIVAFCLLSAPAFAADDIEGTWSFEGGEVLVENTGDGTFKGTVVKPTRFSPCEHAVGEQMWEIRATADPGHYEGGHNWFNSQCTIVSPRGPSRWVVLRADNAAWSLYFCTSSPDATPNSEPTCENLSRLRPSLPAPTAAQSVVLPSASRACRSRRSFLVHLRQNRRDPLVRASIRVAGRVVRTIGFKRIAVPVNLRGLPRGVYTVSITAVTATGKVITTKRRYRTCARR